MKINKILWPTDFSKNAEYALPYITSLIENYQAEIHILYVIEDIAHHEPLYGEFKQPHVDRLVEWEKETAVKRLDQICNKYLNECRMYIKHTALGDPAQKILEFIETEKMDMVVMSRKGREGHFSFGSVAEKVLKHSGVPVVIIPTDKDNKGV
jgi:nucleotide-binding universal stress UspA family protein